MGHFWSLAVEEQFYLVWPATILFCSNKVLKSICYLAIPFSLVMRVILLYGKHNAAGAFVFTLCQLDCLAMGGLVALLVREREEAVSVMARPLCLVGGFAWVGCCMDKNVLLTVGVTAFSAMSAGLLILSLYHPIRVVFSSRPLRSFGKYSYAIYVFHVMLLPFVVSLRARLGSPLFIFFFEAVSFSLGWASWHLFEKYFLRLKRFFPANVSPILGSAPRVEAAKGS